MNTKFRNKEALLQSTADEVFGLLQQGKHVSMVCLPRMFRTEFASNLMQSSPLENTIIVFVDLTLNSLLIQEIINRTLNKHLQSANVIEQVETLSKTSTILLIIDNCNFKDSEKLKYLLNLRLHGRVQFLALFTRSELELPKEINNTNDFGLLFTNIIQVPYFTKEQTIDWINLINVNLSNIDKDLIWNWCGGIPGLIRYAIDLHERYRSIETVAGSKEFSMLANHLWSRFTRDEQAVLLGNTDKQLMGTKKYMQELNALEFVGKWITLITNNLGLEFSGDLIFYKGKVLNDQLQSREIVVLTELLEKGILTKEQIADLIWNKFQDDKYSQWAIDQLMHRLRLKLKEITGQDQIETVRGKGYQLINI